jgi:damage-control phosphatase, subfamily III
MTPEDIEHLQTIGRDAQAARKEFILKDDQGAVWEHIMTLKDARIDFVLDNGRTFILPSAVTVV